ncbi:DNA translocase FtsK [uncultured Thiohalocapsa sp.]|uniref:DNA translocase FtsK n=1 Tax=uncultured Thiohalocapsa sp. TaxID=768990 RepID=UPI0025D577C8|nr:DNA translocase FtsK [uncultured Thiohalocapsa sp.]
MSQATRAGRLTLGDYLDRAWREGAMWTLVCAALYLVVALASYSPQDPGWSYVGQSSSVANAGGRIGAVFADFALFLFGVLAYLLPVMVAWSAYLVFRQRAPEPETKLFWLVLRWVGFLLLLTAGAALASIYGAHLMPELPNGIGGGLGLLVTEYAVLGFGSAGAPLALTALFLVGFLLTTGISPLMVVDGLGGLTLALFRLPVQGLRALGRMRWRIPMPRLPRRRSADAAEIDADDVAEDLEDAPEPAVTGTVSEAELGPARTRPQDARSPAEPDDAALDDAVLTDVASFYGRAAAEPIPEPAAADPFAPTEQRLPDAFSEPAPEMPSQASPEMHRVAPASAKRSRGRTSADGRQLPLPRLAGAYGDRPPLELLDPPKKSSRAVSPAQLEAMSRELEARLAEFGVVAEVVAVHPGPVVALFELELAPGVKVSKITGLAKDIARALSKVSVRVVEVIPGKSVIGLEVPNDQREMVYLSETLGSHAYVEAKSPLTIGMGTDIAGEPVVADLGRMPHALIAGTTGSGKSVAINAMILSLLYKSSAEDVRLIMVDPKMLELSVYEGIPHLLTPVVTDMKEAANALRWCVGEMERRYKLMAALGVRNIAGFNRKVQEAIDAGAPIPDPLYKLADDMAPAFGATGEPEIPTLTKLPYIVVIIDELADMMMVVGKKVEELIARLAQKARASGIHLLLATQRPSVDVLTGLIKANIPTRMAFKVSARVDSRTVLDQMGAEHLLGHGDMLYLPPGGSIPQRVHGAFVDDHEVHRVVDFLKQQGEPDYIDDILQEPGEHLPGIDPEPKGGGDVEDQDPLFDEAVQYVVESRRASISGVQRKLKIGYNRAARMVEEMERIGIVGPAETNGNREVLAPTPVEG